MSSTSKRPASIWLTRSTRTSGQVGFWSAEETPELDDAGVDDDGSPDGRIAPESPPPPRALAPWTNRASVMVK